MKPQEFYDAMLELDNEFGGDTEILHARADDLLCKALAESGYEDGIRLYATMPKWYA